MQPAESRVFQENNPQECRDLSHFFSATEFSELSCKNIDVFTSIQGARVRRHGRHVSMVIENTLEYNASDFSEFGRSPWKRLICGLTNEEPCLSAGGQLNLSCFIQRGGQWQAVQEIANQGSKCPRLVQ
jgi:hypothetical protein